MTQGSLTQDGWLGTIERLGGAERLEQEGREVDGTTVDQMGVNGKAYGGLWCVQAVFDLPTERFSAFDLTDEKVGEQFDRAAVIAG